VTAGAEPALGHRWADPVLPPAPPSLRERLAPAIGLLVVGLVLAVLGRLWAAAVAVLVSLVIAQASMVSDAFVRRLATVQHRVAHAVGVGLATILLLPVHYLILTPIGLVLRLLRVDMLGPPSGASGWQARSTSHVDRPLRTYGDERSILAPATRRSQRARTVRTVLAVLAVQALLFGAFRLVEKRSTPVPEFSGASTLGPPIRRPYATSPGSPRRCLSWGRLLEAGCTRLPRWARSVTSRVVTSMWRTACGGAM